MNRRIAVLRSVTIVSVSTYIEYALGLVVSVWIARALGPSDFGRYAFTVWLCGWLIVCSNNALITSSTKFIAETSGAGAPNTASHIAQRLSFFQTLSSLMLVGIFVFVTWLVQPSEWQQLLLPVTLLVAVAVISKANYGMLVAISKGYERFEPEAISTVIAGVIGAAMVILATWARVGLIAFIEIFVLASLILNLVNRIAYRKYCPPLTTGVIPSDIKIRLYRHLRLTGALVLLGSFKGSTIEVFLLNTFATSTAVGFFAIATTLTRGAVQLFSVGLTSTLLPYMAKSYGQHGREYAAHFLSEATRFYWAVGVAIAGLGLVCTRDIVTLMYGNRYLDAIPAIETILALSGLSLVINGISAFQTVVDLQSDRIRITVAALSVNALLGLLLIPRYGLVGAVTTYGCTRVTELAISIFYLRRCTTGRLPAASMSRLFLVGILATTLAWLATTIIPGHYGFILGMMVFLLTYGPVSLLITYWTNEDFQLISMIAAHLGSPGRWLMRGINKLRCLQMKSFS